MGRYLLAIFYSLSSFLLAGELQAARLKCGDVYQVKAGDSLGAIASSIYGRSSQYSLIYTANSDILKDASSIRVGQKLKIPCAQTAAASAKKQEDTEKKLHPNEALFFAARDAKLKQVATLIRQGANPRFRNQARETAMHAAASKGKVDILHYLHSKGAHLNSQTINGWLPLHHAVRFGHVRAAQYLIQIGSPVYASTRDNVTVFDIAYATRNGAMINLLRHYQR